MKITRKQLAKIIAEQIATVNKEEIKDVVMDILSDEGGAAGLDPIEDALEDLEDEDISLPDEPIEDIVGDVTGVKRHTDGDYIDTTKLEGKVRITKSQLAKIIKEQMSDSAAMRKKAAPPGQGAETDALILIDAIGYAVDDALDQEMQARAEDIEFIKAALMKKSADIMMKIDDSFEDYLKKVKMDGRSTAY